MLNRKYGSTILGIGTAVFVLGLIFYSEYYHIDQVASEILLDTNHTILNQSLAYPESTPNIVTKIITIPKHAETGFHTHDEILIGYVIQGEITVAYEDHGEKVYSKGDSLIEAIDILHNGMNHGNIDAKIFVVTLN
ncbi:MAG: cupin domain-containing protein [Methylococcaceae bacterium]